MARGRPVTPLGAHGTVRYYNAPGGKIRARTQLRLHNGMSVQVQGTGRSRAAATRALEINCQDRLKGGINSDLSTNSRLIDLLERWYEQHQAAPSTRRTYKGCISKHIKPALGQVRLNELSTRRLQAFLDTLTPGTAQTARAVLSNALGLAVRWDVMQHNPMRETTSANRAKKPVNALTDTQIEELRSRIARWIDNAPRGYSRGESLLEIVDLLRGSGIRIGEALALRWSDINFTTHQITISGTVDNAGGRQPFPKTKTSRRTIHITTGAVEALRRQQAKGYQVAIPEIVFPSARGTYRAVVNFERQFRDARGDMKIKPHDFRKTVGTRIEQEFGTLAASRHLGHANSVVTEQAYLAPPKEQPDFTHAFE